jgi:hypothetical protein
MRVINTLTITNQNGGFYKWGNHYGLAKKCEVALAFLQLPEGNATFFPLLCGLPKGQK